MPVEWARRPVSLQPAPVPDDGKPLPGVVEEPRDGVQLVCSVGERAKDGKVQDDNGNQDGHDVEQVVVDGVAVAAAEGDRPVPGLLLQARLFQGECDVEEGQEEEGEYGLVVEHFDLFLLVLVAALMLQKTNGTG